jgi:hypothetical protein
MPCYAGSGGFASTWLLRTLRTHTGTIQFHKGTTIVGVGRQHYIGRTFISKQVGARELWGARIS